MAILLRSVSALAVLLLLMTGAVHAAQDDGMGVAIASLYNDILALQWNETKELHLMVFWGHQKGQFQNDVHMNFVGGPVMQKLRREFAIPDDNMFVTQFVLEALMEAGTLWPVLAPIQDEAVIAPGISSTLLSQDKTYNDSTMPLFGFWPQEWKKNLDGNYAWRQWSVNMSPDLSDSVVATDLAEWFMDHLGLKWVYQHTVALAANALVDFVHSFNMPSDADDTCTTIAFTRWFDTASAVIPTATQLWQANNFNISAGLTRIVETSYCPAGPVDDQLRAALDARSFFWARFFLRNITDPDACIVATWIETVDQEAPVLQGTRGGPVMPFNVNNIDPTVGANTLFGMSTALLQGHSGWFNEQAQKVYVTTAQFVAFSLETQPTQTRPDLEMLYYPPTVNLPYFVARHLKTLETYLATNGALPFPAMETVYTTLKAALRDGGMNYLFNSQAESCDGGNANAACWDGFLGRRDTDWDNASAPNHDDRFFTTASAVNALLDTWTVGNANGSTVSWLSDTPTAVKSLVQAGTVYLLDKYDAANTSFMNAFFSGDMKGADDLPFNYPPNFIMEMTNYTQYTCDTYPASALSHTTFWAVVGNNFTEEAYQQQLAAGCAGRPSTPAFAGFNGEIPWPFWSAPVVSKAFAMSALAKARMLF